MKNPDYSDRPSKDDQESHPKGHPLLIIMVVVICMTVLMAFASSVAKSAESLATVTQSQQSIFKDWKPPVAQPVKLPSPVSPQTAKVIAEKWGVELISLRLTAAGYMIDFRFRVLDEKKANSFFDQRIKPLLVVEKSNAKLPVPMAAKVGTFRPTNRGKSIRPNKIYYMVFGNPDAHVKSGEKVTMVIGDFKAEHLTVN